MYQVILATSLLVQLPPSSGTTPGPLGVREVLSRWEAGANLIESYDLSLELTQKTYTQQDKKDGSWKLLAEADAITFPTDYSRIYRKGIKRRGEFGGDGRANYTVHMIWDGERAHKFRGETAETDRFIFVFGSEQYEDYEANYRTYLGSVDRIALARERNARLLPREGRLYVVDVPAATHGDYCNFHWRAWLDPDRNYLPTKIVHWYVKRDVEEHHLDVENDLSEVAVGVFAPVRSRIRTFFQDKKSPLYDKVRGFRELTVIAERSRYNIELPDSLFDPKIANGLTVIDRSRNAVYTQGSDNAEQYLTQMAADEKKKLANVPPKDRVPPQTVFIPDDRRSGWVVWGSAVGLTLLGVLIARIFWVGKSRGSTS